MILDYFYFFTISIARQRLKVNYLDLFPVSNFRFISPLSAIPLVAMSGFGLYEFGFPLVICLCHIRRN